MLNKLMVIIVPILLFLLQQSFLTAAPLFFPYINLILIYCISLLIIVNADFALYNTLFFGILSDVYSPNLFGLYTISLMFSIFLAHIFLRQLFTNRSIYTFIFLTIIATLSFQLCHQIILLTANIFTMRTTFSVFFSQRYFLSMLYENIANVVVISIIFYVVNYFSFKLKTFFIKI